ncbi:RNA polymerase sigma factor [Flagellimonas pacifica]|uniref:RNA polymerase sigma-70 factor, ECF subfamily n=1 Tax=Flagellimonas pacifica TaxID=1247520 RepID=A0A285MTP6_9FLAO|nr:sigma-70 family RNA polymerase sigma factor [Allomuricauda parva]SNZ00569.1 RNA polymerase sigma-70 factor, ECF subfamily [Allomuricauda parva]
MTGGQPNIANQIDHLFRHEYGKLIAVMTKAFGVPNIDLAEDVVQEAMIEALNKWTYHGVPDNPVGWIYKVAKNKAINILNREKYSRKYVSEVAPHLQSEWTSEAALKRIFTDKEIADDQLRLIFTCCHPVLSKDSQVALTLKTLCGFSIHEITKAFLTTDSNINKRLVRARKTIKDANIPFEVPTGSQLEPRLSGVLETIYLLFNEGYNSTSDDSLIRNELCEEAIRLMNIIVQNPSIKSSNAHALLALMLFNTARFISRMDELSNSISLEHQDRTKWDRKLIKKGLTHLAFAAEQNEVSIYHLLATISAQHCTAPTYETTDWDGILSLYDMLVEIEDSPIVQLNRTIVLSKVSGPKVAIAQLKNIETHPSLQGYLPFYTSCAVLYYQNHQIKKAIELLNTALKLPIGKHRKSLINNKIKEYSKNI